MLAVGKGDAKLVEREQRAWKVCSFSTTRIQGGKALIDGGPERGDLEKQVRGEF